MHTLIRLIQENLTPDLLTGQWTRQHHPLAGHCYVASEALYQFVDREQWKPMVASYRCVRGRCSHWWLQHRVTGEVMDPTAGQFDEAFRRHLYTRGRGTGFLTKQPCKRTRHLLKKLNLPPK